MPSWSPRVFPLLALLVLSGCGGSGSETTAEPPPEPMIVSGVLREGYSGEPVTHGLLLLVEPLPRPDDLPIANSTPTRYASETAVTDAGGAFRFPPVVRTAEFDHAVLHWRAVDAPAEQMFPVFKAGSNTPVTVPLAWHGQPAADVDVGSVQIWIPSRAGDRFVPVCRGAQAAAVVPGPPGVLVYERSGGEYSLSEPWVQFAVGKSWPEEWTGVVCISETTTRVGRYEASGNERPIEAHVTRWRVRVVRIPDGTTFERNFEAHPPGMVVHPVYDNRVKGNPVPDLTKWIERLDRSP